MLAGAGARRASAAGASTVNERYRRRRVSHCYDGARPDDRNLIARFIAVNEELVGWTERESGVFMRRAFLATFL
jgi:hypothetical protein